MSDSDFSKKAEWALTATQREEVVRTIKECIHADTNVEVGPILENPNPNEPGIWILVTGHRGYLGASFQAALKTSQLSDW